MKDRKDRSTIEATIGDLTAETHSSAASSAVASTPTAIPAFLRVFGQTDFNRGLTPFLDHASLRALTRVSRTTHTLSQPVFSPSQFLEHVANGEQDKVEVVLLKEKLEMVQGMRQEKNSLLRRKGRITYGGLTFESITAFQYAFWALDRHMWTLLLEYLPLEEAARQLRELAENNLKYDLVLLSYSDEEKWESPESFEKLRTISSRNKNSPVLIKQGLYPNERLSLYGYHFMEATWKLTTWSKPLAETVFKDLDFPKLDLFVGHCLQISPVAPEEKNLPTDDKKADDKNAYVLVQPEAGKPPVALYYIDRNNQAGPSVTEIDFPINQHISTLTAALYPTVDDNIFTEIKELSGEQVQELQFITGQTERVIAKTSLSPKIFDELAAQKAHNPVTVHGPHFDFTRLRDALKVYVKNYEPWTRDQCNYYLVKVVGGAQRQAVAHLFAEYCRNDRSFDPLPDFKEMNLPGRPRLYDGTDFLPLRVDSGLGFDFALIRAGGRPWRLSWVGGRRGAVDLAAISRLGEIRTLEALELRQQLLKPVPSPTFGR